MDHKSLLESLAEAFGWLEARGLRVGRLWLNKREIDLLLTEKDAFDRESNRTVLDGVSEQAGASFVGYLWGAHTFESPEVPEGHIAILPDDFDAKLIGSAACMPLLRSAAKV